MSQYGLIYRLEFINVEGFTIRTDIYPTDILIDDAATPTVIELKGGKQPVVIQASNNDEDKFTPIRSKSAKITFRSDMFSGLDSSTFSQGSDNLWRVDIYLQDTPQLIFRGFLMMADNQQPFQPDPQYVTLTATDHLAALKEAALTDLGGLNPLGKYRVADLINFCLWKTGMQLSFFVVNNLRAGGGQFDYSITFNSGTDTITGFSDTRQFYIGQSIVITGTSSNNITTFVTDKTSTQITVSDALVTEFAPATTILDYYSQFHWYDVVYVDAKTFEKEIGTCEDCYTVLGKLLGEDCFITQWHGNWWIYRVDEMEDNPTYIAEFTAAGAYVSTATDVIEKSIGRNEDSKFANADTLLRFVRPHDFIKETFRFTSPLELPCNVDFSRGDLFSTVSATEKWFDLDCWTQRRGLPGAYNTPITITDYITRIYNENSYEVERFIFITPQTGHAGFSSTDDEYIESEAMPSLLKDKYTISVDWKFDSDIGSSSADLRLLRIVLIGDDGSGWILGNATPGDGIPIWYNTSGFTINTGKGATPVIFGDQDETEWQSITWEVPPLPVSGDVYIWLNQAYTNAAVPSGTIIYYSNLRVDYIPYINGSYAKYSGQYSEVDRTEDGYLANRDREVFISDSPTKIYKGAMFLFINGVYILVPFWFASAPFVSGYPPDQGYLHPYGYIQAFSVWNQYKGYNEPVYNRGTGINIFQGSVYGLTDAWPDLLHKYTLVDMNTQTNNRYFLLISMSQDWKTCIWTASFIEVYNTVLFKSYSDPFTFKYISQ